MSREVEPAVALRMTLRRRMRFGDMRSHSRFVHRTKLILPGLAVALLLLVGTWPEIKTAIDRLHVTAPRIDLSEARNLRIVDPRYTGIDRDNRPYVLTASSATQTSPKAELITLTAPRADMVTTHGDWVEVTSRSGTYRPQPHILDLFGNVELYQDRGNEFHTAAARIDIAHGTAAGDQPVTGQGPFGHVVAQGFAMYDRGAVIDFTGKANLTLLPRPKEAE